MSDISFEMLSLLIERGPMKTDKLHALLCERGLERGREAIPALGLKLERRGEVSRTNDGKGHVYQATETGRAAWLQRFDEMSGLIKSHARVRRSIGA